MTANYFSLLNSCWYSCIPEKYSAFKEWLKRKLYLTCNVFLAFIFQGFLLFWHFACFYYIFGIKMPYNWWLNFNFVWSPSSLLDIQSKHICDKLLHIKYFLAEFIHVQRNTLIAYRTINYFGNLRTVVSSLPFLTWQWISSVECISFILFFLFISYQVISHILKLLNHQYTYNSSLYDIYIAFLSTIKDLYMIRDSVSDNILHLTCFRYFLCAKIRKSTIKKME